MYAANAAVPRPTPSASKAMTNASSTRSGGIRVSEREPRIDTTCTTPNSHSARLMPILTIHRPPSKPPIDARPQPGVLGDDADVGLGEAHVEVERRRERRRHAVAELVEEDEQQHEQRRAPAVARDEFVERLDDRLAQRPRPARAQRGLVDDERHRDAGQHEQRRDDEHACDHGRWSARISASAPGTRLEMRYALTWIDVPRPSSASGRISRRNASSTMSWLALKNATVAASARSPRCRRCGSRRAEQRDRREQRDLRDEHPAAPAAEQRQRVAVEQRRPQELPRVRKLDQREEADRLRSTPSVRSHAGTRLISR